MDLRAPADPFARRHLGPRESDVTAMLGTLGLASLDELADRTLPPGIRAKAPLAIAEGPGEAQLAAELRALAGQNRVLRSYLGLGYHDCVVPGVIQRNIFENPGWYTQYTPYQAEIAQGRLEALLNFQTLVSDLTGLPVANASLLDEATAAAEAMALCHQALRGARQTFWAAADCHPQTLDVVRTRADALGVEVVVGDPASPSFGPDVFGVLVQVPATDGRLYDPSDVLRRAHDAGALAVVATDPLFLCLGKPPGELGADVAVGSMQRFGVPLGYGGPHAAFLATTDKHQRQIPGRIVGVSQDARGKPALRLALQTREQHIRREKATSNICTAQVLLAVMASMYAVYHGPDGLRRIARRVHAMTAALAERLRGLGLSVPDAFFDTLAVDLGRSGPDADAVLAAALDRGINLRKLGARKVGVALDETVELTDVGDVAAAFAAAAGRKIEATAAAPTSGASALPPSLQRTSDFLGHPTFHAYHSETEMLRYMHRLESKDLALNEAMIPLGSCTMKLNATAEMVPVTLPGFSRIHPFAPPSQVPGYQKLIAELEQMIRDMTGFAGVSLQPNAGSQGELAGLLVIRAYHRDRGDTGRRVCLIPQSAHGTNPASAALAGMRVVVVACDERGNIDLSDLEAKAAQHENELAALMVTYPSTHGVFEAGIKDICRIVHARGGQVYMDGANFNAMVGLSRPADIGADVAHLNLHKTFAIPHGGGGPGMGPIGVAQHLTPFLPGHPVIRVGGERAIGAVSAAPYGSSSILPISWTYMKLMGGSGLTRASQVAILNANYMAKRLSAHYPVLYQGQGGMVAHEFIIDLRPFKVSADVSVDDVAKRLMDYGFHAPTMSWPVAGTMMIEPTESESKAELDRFCEAMIAIRKEIDAVERGELDRADNPLKHAPHTAEAVCADAWPHKYSRELAAYPAPGLRAHKFWPAVARVDNAWGDRNFACTCPPIEAYADTV